MRTAPGATRSAEASGEALWTMIFSMLTISIIPMAHFVKANDDGTTKLLTAVSEASPVDAFRSTSWPEYRTNSELEWDDAHLRECLEYHHTNGSDCQSGEQQRLDRNRRFVSLTYGSESDDFYSADRSRVPPFTVTSLPKQALAELVGLYRQAKESKDWEKEAWPPADTSINRWLSPTYRVDLSKSAARPRLPNQEDDSDPLERLREHLLNAAASFVGEKCQLAHSPQGIRVFSHGAKIAADVAGANLPPQVVASAIILTDSSRASNESPWPLEISSVSKGAKSITKNIVTLQSVGQILWIRSKHLILGSPSPLQLAYSAYMTVHFQLDTDERTLLENNFHDGKPERPRVPIDAMVHIAAQTGAAGPLATWLQIDRDLVHVVDENGWTPLHETARSLHLEACKLLVIFGADVNARTVEADSGGFEGSVLYYAIKYEGESHPVVSYLVSVGALVWPTI
jgi:Ankyrin repeats (3 copies)